ncbi:MAG: metal-dependent hydrolase [Flavobacteriales bacterium]|nr:metal-dependent hydrolase [Flavobacteriales bacterium]
MDSLTQIVLGAAVAELTIGRKVGNRAILWGAVAGTIPDLDVYTGFIFDDLTKNEMHRAFSHSLFFCLIAAPVFSWLVMKHEKAFLATFLAAVLGLFVLGGAPLTGWLIVTGIFLFLGFFIWRMKPIAPISTRTDWTRMMFWTLFTHPLLDAHTSWGTQLLWPLPWKYSWNNIFVADPLYTVPFLLCMIIVLFLSRKNDLRRMMTLTGIVISSTYMLFTLFMKWVTFSRFTESLEEQGYDLIDISTRPTVLNCILWTANVDVGDAYLMSYYSVLDKSPIHWVRIPKNEHLLAPLAHHEEVERLWHLTAGEFAITQKNDTLVYNDLRFGMFGEPVEGGDFVFAYKLIPDGDRLIVEEIPPPRPEGEEAKQQFAELWERIKGI